MKINMKLAVGLGVLGVILLVFSIVWITVIEPDLEKLPTDLDESYTADGTIDVSPLFKDFIPLDNPQIKIDSHQEALKTDGDVLIIQESVVYTPEIEGLLESTIMTMGVDRDSREYVPGYGDREREALWAYPVGVKKQDYVLWSNTAGSAPYARYTGQEKIDGLKVYTFTTDEKDVDYDFDLGLGLPIPVSMDMTIEEKVEPHTGITVYLKSVRNFNIAVNQDLLMLLGNPAVAQMIPPELEGLIALLPKEIGPEGLKIPAMTITQQYSEETVDAKVSDAKYYKTRLLWATKYGLWIGISLGVVLLLAGGWLAFRARKLGALS